MQPLTPEQLFAKYEKIPKDLQDAILDAGTSDIIGAITKKYGLNLEQAGNLADEVGLLMLGETNPRDFTANLIKRLETDPEMTKKIAQEINEQIFSKVRESLKKIHGVSEEEKQGAAGPQPAKTETPAPKPSSGLGESRPSPFEQKLEDKVFPPKADQPLAGVPALKKEVEQAQKENRYPSSADPYREPPK